MLNWLFEFEKIRCEEDCPFIQETLEKVSEGESEYTGWDYYYWYSRREVNGREGSIYQYNTFGEMIESISDMDIEHELFWDHEGGTRLVLATNCPINPRNGEINWDD